MSKLKSHTFSQSVFSWSDLRKSALACVLDPRQAVRRPLSCPHFLTLVPVSVTHTPENLDRLGHLRSSRAVCSVLNIHLGQEGSQMWCVTLRLSGSSHSPKPSSEFPGGWDVLWAPHQGQVLLPYTGLNIDGQLLEPRSGLQLFISLETVWFGFCFPLLFLLERTNVAFSSLPAVNSSKIWRLWCLSLARLHISS